MRRFLHLGSDNPAASRHDGYLPWLRQGIRKWLALALFLAGLALVCATLFGVSVRSTIDPSAIVQAKIGEGENIFAFDLRYWSVLMRSDGMGFPKASRLRLFEDGRPLGPVHSLHADIAALGEGRYSHWRGAIIFSSSDNSDPRTNGRAYSYAGNLWFPTELLLVGMLFIAGALWLRRQRVGSDLSLVASASFLLAAISFLWLFHLLSLTRQDIAQDEVPTIIGYCLLVISLQTFVVFLFPRYVTILFTAFGVANTYSLFFVFSSDLTTYSLFVQLILLLAIGALYFILFQLMVRPRRPRRWAVGAASLVIVVVVGIAGVVPTVTGPGSMRPDAPKFPGIRVVEFTRHPNVYFLGMDGLMPARLTEKHLLVENPPYVNVIKKHGGRIIPNMFADQVRTKYYWARILNILPVERPLPETIVGIEPSPVLATFQRNGYETHFSFWNTYMGVNKGSYLTTYEVSDPYSSCSFLDDLPKQYGFLGYCALSEPNWFFSASAHDTGNAFDRWNQFYLERLRSVTRDTSSRRHFFASHFPLPGHTSMSYRQGAEEFRQHRRRWISKSEEAARFLESMLSEIKASDPTAIIFVFGDHGGLLSTGMDYSDDFEFVVQDRHGIMGAVFGTEECMPFLQPPEGERIQTSSRVVAGILQCLAGGTSPLTVDHDFRKINARTSNNLRFDDYAYE